MGSYRRVGKTFGRAAGLMLLFGTACLPASAQHAAHRPKPAAKSAGIPLGQPTPAFTLNDADGKPHTLGETRGNRAVLCFFCGCEPCHAFARLWGQMQQSGALAANAAAPNAGRDAAPRTLVVFIGSADALKRFAAETGLAEKETLLLPDPQMRVVNRYRAVPCPRLFVLDAAGKLRYTNDHREDAPPKAPAALLVSRVADALQKMPAVPGHAKSGASGAVPIHAQIRPAHFFRTGRGLRTENSLRFVPDRGTTALSPMEWQCDVGLLDRRRTPTLRRIFTLQNGGMTPVLVERLQTSCGCATVLAGQGGKARKMPLTLAPGESAAVEVEMALNNISPGAFEKYVWAYLPNETEPAATLRLVGVLHTEASLAPLRLDFGRKSAGTSAALPLTLTLDARLLEKFGGKPPRLVSSNPDVTVRADTAEPQTLTGDGQTVVRLPYVVTLSEKARLGMAAGTISLVPLVPESGKGARQGGRNPAESPAVEATFAAEVAGEVTAVPATLLFGTTPQGRAITRTLRLRARSAELLRGIVAEESRPFFSLRFGEIVERNAAGEAASEGELPRFSRTVEVVVSGKAPAGVLQTEITLRLANGQRLVVPLLAYVLSRARP